MNEFEFEQIIIKVFEDAGWQVRIPKPFQMENYKQICPDLEILYNDKSYGYVEVKRNLNPDKMLEKINQWKTILTELKPLLFIITDGIEYHVSIRGKEFELLHFVPGPLSYYAIVGLVEEWVEFLNKKEESI